MKAQLSSSIHHPTAHHAGVSNQTSCQLFHQRQPPDPSTPVEIHACDSCGKLFHIQCLNTNLKNKKMKYRKNTKHLLCLNCKSNDVSNSRNPITHFQPTGRQESSEA